MRIGSENVVDGTDNDLWRRWMGLVEERSVISMIWEVMGKMDWWCPERRLTFGQCHVGQNGV